MSVKVKQLRLDQDRRYTNRDLVVYIDDTELHKIADAWFNRNNLYQLNVKSKAWNTIIKYLNSVLEPRIAQHFKVPKASCKYKRTAGCRCGCSPGFIVKNVPYELQRHNAWANVPVAPVEIQGLKVLIQSEKFQRKWNKDLQTAQMVQAA
jgi:hypothetical protein